MITCIFENGKKSSQRHVVVDDIAVNDTNEFLLVRRALGLTRGGKLTVPGGFLDRGEDSRQGVLRELQEETGYTGEILHLFHINDNPNRLHEDRQNVAFVYIVKVTGGEKTENDEVTEIQWYSLNELPDEQEFAFDHRKTLLLYFEYLKKPFSLPIVGTLPRR
jgi:8-oxo-dGTP diphosphatase